MRRAGGLFLSITCLGLLFGTICGAIPARSAAARQAAPASICVLAFVDTNQNGIREQTEPPLIGANISLLMAGAYVIANHITDGQGQYCFNNLTPEQYTITFADPLAQATTATSLTVNVNVGEQVTRAFGAVPLVLATVQPNDGKLVVTLTRLGRVGLAALGALMMMLFTIGIGLIVRNGYSIARYRQVVRRAADQAAKEQQAAAKNATITIKVSKLG